MQATPHEIDELNQKAYSSIYSDISLAGALAKEARELSSEANYTGGIAWSLLIEGLLDIEQGKLDQAEGKLYQAHHIFIDLNNDMKGKCASLNGLGLINIRRGNSTDAFSYLEDALELAQKYKLKNMEFKAVNLMGVLQFHRENYNQAMRFFTKAMKLITTEQQSHIFNNLGCCYRALGKYEKALEYLYKALDEAQKAQIRDIQIPILEEIGLTYGKVEAYDEGIEILEKALSLTNDFHKRYKLSINIKLGELYIKLEDFKSAETCLNRARDYITYANSISNRDLYLYLSGISEIKEDYKKALTHYKNYHLLSGKLKSTELDEKVWELETKSFKEINRRIRKIGEMGKEMTALLDRESIISTMINSVNSIFKIEYFSLGIWERERRILKLYIYSHEGKLLKSRIIDTERPMNPESWVAVHRTGLIFNSLNEDYCSYFPELDSPLPSEQIASVLCLPFESGEEKGLVGIYHSQNNAYNREDYEILEMLNSYAAIALSNSHQTEIIQQKNRELEKLNKYDELTGIYNRRHLNHELEKSWNYCRRNKQLIHLMLLDVDHFKDINDTYGHDAGDHCLKTMGDELSSLLQRATDIYGRYGGEEFIVVFQNIPSEEAEHMAEKIRKTLDEKEIIWKGQPLSLTVSIGLCSTALWKKGNLGIKDLVSQADKNMYIAKKLGRNRLISSEI